MTLLKAGRPSNTVEALKMMADIEDPVVKVSVNMIKSLHKKIKQYALQHDMSLTEVIHISLQEYIKK